MGPVMLHMMDLCLDCPRRHSKTVFQFLSDVMYLSSVLQTVPHSREAGALREGIQSLLQQIGTGVSIDGDMVNGRNRHTGLFQACTYGFRGEPRPVLHPAKPLFFSRSNKLPTYYEAG